MNRTDRKAVKLFAWWVIAAARRIQARLIVRAWLCEAMDEAIFESLADRR